ncbi:MAG: HPF/RaiA family ribosome-associated protein, partial [Methylocystis sp.]|uniref:HPF/RaiA family ribosome-associated protein n=1 Tax=Methylocystis sp. TaxID=1911079 RepID=UPI003DA5816B
MQIPLQITVRDMPHSHALETYIREKVQKLDAFFGRLVSCRVVVEVPHRHRQQGNQFNVRIDMGVPGNELVVTRDHHEDPYVALRDAFDAAKRQLENYVRRMRRETKAHSPEHVGHVTRISQKEGFGFIAGPDGNERYFHSDSVASPSFDKLKAGDEVKFVDDIGNEGPQAKRVSVG